MPLDFKCADEKETAPRLVQRAIEAGAFVTIAHPEWYSLTFDECLSLSHAHGIEIYNHSCHIEAQRGFGTAAADYLLQENKRISMLNAIAKQYTIIFDYYKNIQVAKVTTAVPITAAIEKQVLAKIEALTGEKASLENEVNPNILGGFILRVGDVQYDASISNHLSELKKEFDNSHYIPKI